MTVVSLAERRAENAPQWCGVCVCLGCRHEWTGVGPMPSPLTGLECPACKLPKGVHKHPWGATDGDLELLCNCGCEALSAYQRGGRMWVKCMACGTDLTDAFYDG